MKTEAEIQKFRTEVLEQLGGAATENVKFLQGVIYGLDWLKEEKKDDA